MGWCSAQCKMLLFYAKAVMQVSHNIELAHLKRRRKKNSWAVWHLSGLVLSP